MKCANKMFKCLSTKSDNLSVAQMGSSKQSKNLQIQIIKTKNQKFYKMEEKERKKAKNEGFLGVTVDGTVFTLELVGWSGE